MRKLFMAVMCLTVGMFIAGSSFAAGKNDVAKKVAAKGKNGKLMVVADFESGTPPNNVGGGYGAWNKDPNDTTQGCTMSFVSPGQDGKGQSLKLTYDVDSPNPAYNGLWMKLENQDLSKYKKLSFWVKGDKDAGYTSKVKIELKNDSESGSTYVEDISDKWVLVEIPLSNFDKITDWSKMTEFVLVFEDNQVTQKTGAIDIDTVAFLK